MTEQPKMKIVKKGETLQRDDDRSRSEYTLLWELIQRNPERAKEFLRRLGESMKAAA